MIDTWADYTMRSIKVSKVGIIWVQSSEPDKRGVLFFQLIFISQLLWYEWAIEFTPSSNWTCMYKATLPRFLAKLEFRYSLENCSYVYNISSFCTVGSELATAGEGIRPVRPSGYFWSLTFQLFSWAVYTLALSYPAGPLLFLLLCLILTCSNKLQFKKSTVL